MNRSVLAACAVVSMAGTSYGWSLLTFGQPMEYNPGGPDIDNDIRPSSGLIRLAEVFDASSSAYVPEFNNDMYGMVTGVAATWAARRTDINNSSWFGFDPTGPDGAYTLGNASTNRPAWNAGYSSHPIYGGFGTPTGPTWSGSGDGDDLVSGIDGGPPGWAFLVDIGPLDDGTPPTGVVSNVSALGGPSIMDGLHYDWTESVFVGHITVTDPSAHLRGTFLVTTRDGRGPAEGWELDLDGTPSLDLKMIQVRDGSSINLFVVEIPAPGAIGALTIAGAAGAVRRRRH